MIFIFLTRNVFASEDIVLNKYGYGSLIWDGIKHDKPEIWPYPLPENQANYARYHSYEISDTQNFINQLKYEINIELTIQQKKNDLFALVQFHNNSPHNYFIHRSKLSVDDPIFYPLCSNAFSINTDNIHLNYLKQRCQLDSEREKDNWQLIPAGNAYSFSVKLNDAYAFPPGLRRYNIGSLEYTIVKEEWFIEQSINNLFLSILEWKYSCMEKDGENYVIKARNVCDPYRNNIQEILLELGLDGVDYDNHFIARTNQCVIMIDGSTLKSIYDKNL